MDSLVDMDLMNLNAQDIDMVSTLIVDSTVTTHETEADLASYRAEFAELQAEVAALKLRKKALEEDIELSKVFTQRAIAYQSASSVPAPAPKASSNSKWGILKTSILAKPETIKVFPAPNVHVPVQPAFAKFFYLVEKLELARRTSKFVGIRAKAPRADYVEKCVLLRKVVIDAAIEKAVDLTSDIALLKLINADAVRTTLAILEQQQEPADHSFDELFASHKVHAAAPHVSPPPSRPPAPAAASPVLATPAPPPPPPGASHRASVSFAPLPSSSHPHPPPPPAPPASGAHSSAATAAKSTVESPHSDSPTEALSSRRGSILQDFRSRSNSAAASKTDLERSLDPAVLAFRKRAAEIVRRLPTAAELQRSAQRKDISHLVRGNSADFGANDDSGEYKEALQAHCAETLDSFHWEMERKMQDCLLQCKQALARRNGPLAVMKGDAVFAAHIAEVLGRVSELKEQLQSFSKHQLSIRDNTRAEHEEMVREASVTIVQQRMAFLTRIKEKLTSVHQRNQQKLKDGRKQALIGNTNRFQEAMLHSATK